MNEPRQPPRLFGSAEAPPALRAALEGARRSGPSAGEVEQLVRGVETRLARPAHLDPALQGRPGGGLAGSGVRAWVHWLLAGAGIGAAVLAGLLLSRVARQPGVEGRAPGALPATSASVAASGSGGAVPLHAPAPIREREAEPVSPAERTEAAASAAPVKSAPTQSSIARGAPSVSADPAPPAAGPDEFQLLRAARATLSRDPGAALKLADEHAQRFARGLLAQEREAIAVEALTRLGRTGEARARFDRLLRQHPDTPYKTRLEALVAARQSGQGR